MSGHVVIGTAGHVDHGKSALVLALTGTDPDRWAEEKRRGITIDLGFARLTLGAGREASVVDVPGHEDFVRNMVAGATGIDVALLVVAADEGVMPQTVEHLAILDYLGVREGVVAITKTDLVEPEWLELVHADVAGRLAAHGVRWRAIVPVSAIAGAGLDALRAALAETAEAAVARPADDLFRMPIDRAFSVAGAGTVVTGTVWSGRVRVGDTVRCLPADVAGRVRSIEVHGAPRDEALPGRRTALALVGVAKDQVPRGATVVTDPRWRAGATLDVAVRLLPDRALPGRSRVRVHLGTAEVLARVTPSADDPAIVRLRLEQPLVARWGDRGVLRTYSPATTMGGFVVLDPWPAARPRRPVFAARRAGGDRLQAAVEQGGEGGVPLADLPVRLGLPASVDPPPGVARVGDRLVPAARIDAAAAAIEAALARHHAAHPEGAGLAREALRATAGPLAEVALARLAEAGAVRLAGAVVRAAAHESRLAPADVPVATALAAALVAAGFEGRTAAELAGALRVDPGTVTRVAEYLVRRGEIVRVGRERLFAPAARAALLAEAADLLRAGNATPAGFRERLKLSRKYLIPLLEWLDQEGYSVRDGDARKIGPKFASAGRTEPEGDRVV